MSCRAMDPYDLVFGSETVGLTLTLPPAPVAPPRALALRFCFHAERARRAPRTRLRSLGFRVDRRESSMVRSSTENGSLESRAKSSRALANSSSSLRQCEPLGPSFGTRQRTSPMERLQSSQIASRRVDCEKYSMRACWTATGVPCAVSSSFFSAANCSALAETKVRLALMLDVLTNSGVWKHARWARSTQRNWKMNCSSCESRSARRRSMIISFQMIAKRCQLARERAAGSWSSTAP
mmetsp:Transcript_17364/g.35042  ORF Transcript_17364/g.35042 Transcript_17364/m.35042 type:complete len:238 (-) Transcript_17364:2526-3239(-)